MALDAWASPESVAQTASVYLAGTHGIGALEALPIDGTYPRDQHGWRARRT